MSPSESFSDHAVNSLVLRLLPDTSPNERRRRSRQTLKRRPEGRSRVEKRLISAMPPPFWITSDSRQLVFSPPNGAASSRPWTGRQYLAPNRSRIYLAPDGTAI